MKRDSEKAVKSVDGTDYVEIGAKVHKTLVAIPLIGQY